MAAPRQHVHLQQRRVGQLDEEDPVAGNLGDTGGIVVERQGVKAVHDQAERRMVCPLDDVPGVFPSVDVPAPSQRLVPDAKAAPGGALRHFGQIGGRPVRRR
jgi:hypothetical protein